MEILLAQLLPGADTFSSVELNTAIGVGGLTSLLLGLGAWFKRSLPARFTKWIPHALLVIGMLVFGVYSGWTLSAVIFGFLAANASVGIYEGGKKTVANVKPTSG